MKRFVFAAVIAVALSSSASAQVTVTPGVRSDVPPIVTRGLDAYRTASLGPAIDAWLAGSPAAGESTRAQLLVMVAPLEAAYGRVIGSDIIDVVTVGQHVRRVYVVIRLERGPLYAMFECYQTAEGNWIIPGFLLNAKATEILPARYLGG